jgi:hypothetical protein
MKQLFTLILITGIFLSACTVDNSGYEPTQPVILNDTSQYTGRLVIRVYDITNNNEKVDDAEVNLYGEYDDIAKDLPVLTIYSKSNGEADFGYVLKGQYYITAKKGALGDTAAAQVVSQNITYKNMFLN